MQIGSGKIGSEIRAVPPDCAILHEAVAEKNLLAGAISAFVNNTAPSGPTTRSGIGGALA
jgi:hypothetical protein